MNQGVNGNDVVQPTSVWKRIDELCDQFEAAWKADERPRLEQYLQEVAEADRPELFQQLFPLELHWRLRRQEEPTLEEYVGRFPQYAREVQAALERKGLLPSELLAGVPVEQLVQQLVQGELISASEIWSLQQSLPPQRLPKDARELACELIRQGRLTQYQVTAIHAGRIKDLVFGEYTVLDQIGSGGMGQVFKARHRTMERIVALKVLPPQAMDSPEAVKRFRKEVKAAAKLTNPNIVTAYDAGEHHGTHYLVMEHVEGSDLARLVAKRGPLPTSQAVELVVQAARGLDYAHGRGIVHRDVKPGNLLVDLGGTLKISDMGLARVSQAAAPGNATDSDQMTGSEYVLGTCEFMAPEQAADAHQADHRADVYALGCTLYFLLVGRAPYRRKTVMESLLAHREAEIPSLREARPEVPAELDAVFQKMLAKNPDQRQQSMGDVIADLEACPADLGEQVAEGQPAASGTAPTERRPRPDAEATDTASQECSQATRSYVSPAERPVEPRAKRKKPPVAVLVGAAALLAAVALGVVFMLETPQGTLVLRIDQQDAKVVIDDGKITITTRDDDQPVEVRLQKGKHTFTVSKGGFQTETGRFTITSGKREVVDVELIPLCEGEAVADVDRDRRAARWVQSVGGSVGLMVDGTYASVGPNDELPEQPFDVTGVGLADNPAVTDAGLANLAGLSDLGYLDLAGTPTTDAGLAYLADLPSLRYLMLARTAVSDAGMHHVGKLNGLTFLALHATNVTDRGLERLAGLANLQVLNLTGTQVGDDELRPLESLRELRVLLVFSQPVSDADLPQLLKLEKLEFLGLGVGPGYVTAATLGDLGKLPNLRALSLGGLNWTTKEVEALAKLPHLRELYLTYVVAPDTAEPDYAAVQAALPNCHIETGQEAAIEAYFRWRSEVLGEPHALTDPDRRAAEWVLSVGGTAYLLVDGQPQYLGPDWKLPQGPFHVTGVQLADNPRVTDAGLANLAGLSRLEYLNLQGTPITDAGLAHLADLPSLRRLYLVRTRVTDAGMHHVGKLKGLTFLTMYNTKVTDRGLEHLVGLSGLRVLNVNGTKVGEDGLRPLESLTELRMAVLGSLHVTDAAVPHLSNLKKLECLYLVVGPGRVTAAGLRDLARLPKLRALGLGGSELTTNEVEGLAKLPHLRELHLHIAATPDPVVTALRAALPDCHLETDPETWSAVYNRWLAETYGEPYALTDRDRRAAEWVQSIGGRVVLADNGDLLNFASDAKLPEKPFDLIIVSLREIPGVTDAGLANLSGLPQLQKLELQFAQITDAGLAYLADLESLRMLSLLGTPVGDAGMHHVAKLKGLVDLSLGKTKVTGRGLEQLAGLRNLRVLNLQATDLGDDGLRPLENLTQLRMLMLGGGTRVTDADLPHLLKLEKLESLGFAVGPGYITPARIGDLAKLPHLRALSLGANEWPGSQTVDALLKLEKLELLGLTVGRGRIPAASLGDLAKLPRLRALSLVGDEWPGSKTIDALAKLPHLRELYLNYAVAPGKEEPDVAALQAALPDCRIETDPEAIRALGNRLQSELGWNPYAPVDPDRRAAEWVQGIGGKLGLMIDGEPANLGPNDELPQTPFHVTLVQLSDNAAVTDASLTNLAGLSDLAYLDLSGTATTDAGLAYLTDLPSLCRLLLARTAMSDEGLRHVGKLKGLTSLTLNSTNVTDRSLEHLAGLGNLRFLNLTGTKVSDEGLRHLQSLTELRMLVLTGGTHITDAGLPHLLKLQKLESLCLHVCPGHVTPAGLADLARLPRLRALCLGGTEWPGTQMVDALAKLPHLRELYFNYEEPDVAALQAALPNCRIEADPEAWNPAIIRLHSESPWYGQQPEPEAAGDIDLDRRAAEWVLSVGGKMDLMVDGEHYGDPEGKLPQKPFHVTLVNLGGNPYVTDAGLANLAGLSQLHTLLLERTPITDAGLAHVADLQSLRVLNVQGTLVGDAGLGQIAEAHVHEVFRQAVGYASAYRGVAAANRVQGSGFRSFG